MADVLGFNIPIPSFGIGTGVVTILASIFVVAIAFAIVIYMVYDRRVFNRKIIYFENISGLGFQPTFNDRARLIKLGSGGEEVLFWKKRKVYRTAYGKKMGKNVYWFAKGQDGYDYNITLGDLDAKMGMLDVEVIDRDMRYMHVAIRKNIEERYRKQKFMDKYGTIMLSGIFLLIMIIGIWFLLDKIAEISSQIAGAVSSANALQETSKDTLVALNNVCSRTGGSGIVPV